jgi:hypothetical protein
MTDEELLQRLNDVYARARADELTLSEAAYLLGLCHARLMYRSESCKTCVVFQNEWSKKCLGK